MVQRMADEAAGKTAKKAVKKSTQKSAKKTAQKNGQTSAKATAQKAARRTASDRPAGPGHASEHAGAHASSETSANAVDEQLARYRSMRDFGVTAEPAGEGANGTQPRSGARYPFCVQKHAASHLHYDFRLGWNGVLKSWAVAKGPSYVVADKRLAVQVEDHPMEYGGFEGIIPAGQYGGGTVMLWDQGFWEPQAAYPDVADGLRKGSLKFILHGEKLQGKWALIRMKGRSGGSEAKPNWLLIKEHDDFERPPDKPAVTDAEPNSVVTGRTMQQIAASEDHVWNSKETHAGGRAWYRQSSSRQSPAPETAAAAGADADAATPRRAAAGAEDVQGAAAARSPSGTRSPPLQAMLTRLPREAQPPFLAPQLAQQAESPPSIPGWLHELKLDGYRIQARKSEDKVALLTRTGLDWTHRMPRLAVELATLPVKRATLDGEVVVLREDGNSSFADLQAAFQQNAPHALTYFIFDLLHLDGHDTRGLPLSERKQLLSRMLGEAQDGALRFSEHLEADGAKVFEHACRMHAEGIVSKRAGAAYSSGRSSDWIKCKCLHEQELVIGGYTLPGAGHAGMRGVGALLLGYYETAPGSGNAGLVDAGRTGTGFDQKTHRMLRDRLEALKQAQQPFVRTPAAARRGAHWVRPELVAQVRFATWTADKLVRQAAFLGLREDKPAREVVREISAPTPKSSHRAPSHPGGRTTADARRTTAASTAGPSPRGREGKPRAVLTTPVRLTHPDKLLDESSHLTKRALADYYYAIAERLLPHVTGRPLSLVRCPEGSGHPCFFQKHVTSLLPPGIESVPVPDKKTGKVEPYITLATAEALAGLAQIGVLEVHPWGSRNADLEHPDRLIFDLDPDESLPWTAVTEAAEDVRSRLKKLGLTAFLKTTGGKGLHVVVPVEPALDWPSAKEFAHRLVSGLERSNPRLYLTKMTKAARTGKIYLDYLRNERGATAVAPYSPRARAGAAVSMPLAWPEIGASGDFAQKRPSFRAADFADWRARRDPWKAIGATRQSISAEMLKTMR